MNWFHQAFSERPDPDDLGIPFEILRVPAEGFKKMLITTPNFFGLRTHFWNRQTVPCLAKLPGRHCEACEEGHSSRWMGYLGVWSDKRSEQYILEVTAGSTRSLDQAYEQYKEEGGLRGLMLDAWRSPQRANGRLCFSCAKPKLPEGFYLPDPPDIAKILCHMWGITDNPEEDPTISRQVRKDQNQVEEKRSRSRRRVDGRRPGEKTAAEVLAAFASASAGGNNSK